MLLNDPEPWQASALAGTGIEAQIQALAHLWPLDRLYYNYIINHEEVNAFH